MTVDIKIDPHKQIQRISFGNETYVLVAEKTYEEILRRMDGMQAALEIQKSRTHASYNFVDALTQQKLTPGQVRGVLHARSLGKRLAVLREARGLGQVELAEKAGVSQAAISKLESGETKRPSLELIEKVLAGLDLPDVLTYALTRSDSVSRSDAPRMAFANH